MKSKSSGKIAKCSHQIRTTRLGVVVLLKFSSIIELKTSMLFNQNFFRTLYPAEWKRDALRLIESFYGYIEPNNSNVWLQTYDHHDQDVSIAMVAMALF